MSENWTNKKVDKFVVVNNLLGEGAFGKVYRGFFTNEDSKQVACKVIPIHTISNSTKYLDLIKREISILQKLTHNKYIVKLYDVARTNNNLYIFLEYCQDGDLKEFIKQRQGKLSEKESILFFQHICEGFKDLNKKNIIHRDIKPANLLLHEGSIKISDFGFARSIDGDEAGKYTRLGSPLYMAPQILDGSNFNSKCDVWSVGVVFYEMLFGKTPWIARDQKELTKNIKNKPLVFPNDIQRSSKVRDILRGMLKVNEEERMSWDQVFQHPLLQEAKPEAPPQNIAPQDNIQQEDYELKRMNEQYLEKHLVLNYLNTNVEVVPEASTQETQPTASEVVGQEMKPSVIDEKFLNDSSQMLQYKNEKEFRKSMQRMNSFILYERNITFLFKNTLKTLYSYYFNSQGKNLEKLLYFKAQFCLCKCQAINLQRVDNMIKEDASTCFTDQDLWRKYKKTIEFKQTQEKIQRDTEHSLKFYKIITERVKTYLNKEIEADPSKKDDINKFLLNFNNNFVMDQNFKEAYKSTIKAIIQVFGNEVKNNASEDKDLLILLRYIQVCSNPYQEFRETGQDTDFNQFYEDIENTQPAQLREQVLAKLG